MSVVKLKYEILVSGIYPFEGEYEKLGFKLYKTGQDVIVGCIVSDKQVILGWNGVFANAAVS